jgi:demethoxyubiquinone hydroxylase (CLK1/Coq7/Cat5 family)
VKRRNALLDAARAAVHAANLLVEVTLAEMYRAQVRRARSPKTIGVLRQIQAHEATHACEARARVRAPDSLRRAAEAAARLSGRVVGTATGLLGETGSLAFDYAVERLGEIGYRAGLALVEPGAESERRVLARALGEEREHQNLIRDRLGI